ncbi:uncharacterized protein [Nicotiana tomentosiformis]|uniref:uncharacterized protein n=1 Tax=Nicotiana tomentosiformis TaxID=4098 RepID=UPI00388C9586
MSRIYDWTPLWRAPYYPLEQPVPSVHQTFHQADIMWGTEEDEVLAGMRKLFLDEEDIDCSAIIDSDSEDLEDDIIPEEIFKEVEDFENKPKSNLEETEAVNLGDSETIKETRISIHLSSSEKEEYIRMLRKDVATSWTKECQKAFDKIKEYLSKPPVLVPPEPGRPLLLYLSLLEGVFGYVLGQHDETGRKEQAIYYLSKKFTPYEAWMDPLKYIFQKHMPMGKLAKWQILLSEFDIVYVTQKAVKGQALADHLAENPVDGEYEPWKTYFPDDEVSFVGEDITEAYDGWRMFFDGATNLKGVGIGAVLVSETGQHYPISAKLRFPCTNNMAKYDACILGLRSIGVPGSRRMATKNTKILPYLHCVQELIKRFTKIEFKHVPRIQNEFADALATLSSMLQHPHKNFIDPIPIGIHKQLAYCAHVEEEIDGNPWFHDIMEYLEKGEYPEHATHTQKRTL